MPRIGLPHLVIAAAMSVTSPVAANPVADAWQAIAREDSAAAITMIETGHPGAVSALGDAAFRARLALARAHLAERLPKVVAYPGYAALMEGLAADFGDGHIRSSAVVGAQRINTPGIVLAREGGRWVVGAHDPGGDAVPLTGATFLGCDGLDADAWAMPRIAAFIGDPVLEAVRAKAAGWLLADFGNPFLTRPTSCRFAVTGGAPRDVTLRWRPAFAPALRGALQVTVRPGTAGMKVEPFAAGWWIGLQTLEDAAETVVEMVRANQTALRSAPTVVVDLRGNGGGNSAYADAIARALVGDRRFAAAQPAVPRCAGSFWRAAPATLDALRGSADAAAKRGDEETAAYYRAIADDMTQAIATGRDFAPALPVCANRVGTVDRAAPGRALPPSAMKGRLVLITDRACFSSCLLATDLLLRLGALHLGEATDRSTRYMDVREAMLPSGLRSFTTLTKVAVGSGDYGPFRPVVTYSGTMNDDAALRTWVADTAHRADAVR